MEFENQVEKIFNYLKFNCEIDEIAKIIEFKRQFQGDLNLVGCYLKDYLILEKIKSNFSDDSLYSEFVLYFEENLECKNEILDKIIKFSKYYLMLVFEECDDVQILSIISTINLCYCMDCYPLIMKILDDLNEKRLASSSAIKMLQAISSTVLNRFENPQDYDIDFYNVTIDESGNIYSNISQIERKAV